MNRWILPILLSALPLSAQSWRPELGAVWTQLQGDLRQVGTEHGWGGMVGAELQADESGSLRLFAEYRRFHTPDGGRYSLSDGGLMLIGAITGPLYGTAGLSAERIHLPGYDPTIKLGTRLGLGYALTRHFKLESAYTYASFNHASVNSVEASLVLAF